MTEQNLPGNPVVSVRMAYEVDDDQVTSLARLLTAFPHLKSLNFRSPGITDAGVEEFQKALLTMDGLSPTSRMSQMAKVQMSHTQLAVSLS
jgi:hypothetical protein